MIVFRIICLLFAFYCIVPSAKAQTNIAKMREGYYTAAVDEAFANEFYRDMMALDSLTAPVLAYQAMASFVLANHKTMPIDKLKYFIEGKSQLEEAIDQEPNNLELRYLRFTIQTNAPAFLGYRQNIIADKTHLLTDLVSSESQLDEDLRSRIITFMLESKHCNGNEKKKLKKLIGAQ